MANRIIRLGRPAPKPAPATVPSVPVAVPTGGGTVPVGPAYACERCGAYVVLPDVHDRYHRRLNRFIALVQDVFQRRGYITSNENTTPTAGDTEKEN